MGEATQGDQRLGRPRDPRLDAAIVEATIALLTERGYHDLTLAAVADRAGTTTAAIYRRWGSKSELVTQAVFRTDGDDVVADTGDLAADLATMIGWSVEKIGRPAALAAMAGLLGESRSDRVALSSSAGLAAHRVEQRLERAKTSGELRADLDVRVLGSLISGPVMYAAITGFADALDDEWIAEQVAIVLDGVRAGQPATPRPAARPRRRTRPDTTEVPTR